MKLPFTNNYFKVFKWKQAEKILFLLVVIVSSWPIMATRVFAMLDAPAHLYNAKLLYEMLFKHNIAIGQWYSFNNLIVPNWTGHALLVFLLIFFNALWAQKIFILLYLLIFPFSFRYLISSTKGNIAISYFAFPFAFSFFFFLGFFNFLIGLPIMFFAMGYWIENLNLVKFKFFAVLTLFSVLIYLSHPIIFAIWCVFLLLNFLFGILLISGKSRLRDLLKRIVFLTAAILPSLIIAVLYVLYQPKDAKNIIVTTTQLGTWLKNLRSLVVFNFEKEYNYTHLLFCTIVAMFFLGILYSIYRFRTEIYRTIWAAGRKSIWFVLSGVILVLYFWLPDQSNGGEFISSRLNFLFFIFFVLGIAQLKQFKIVNITVVIIIVIAFNLQLFYYNENMKPLNKNAEAIAGISEYIDEGKTMISIDRTQNWMQGHLIDYAGAGKLVYLHQNYEASKKYFPLVWNLKTKPELYFSDITPGNPCIYLMQSESKKKCQADYVMIIGNNSIDIKCDSLISNSLSNHYTLFYKSADDFVSLYKLQVSK